MADAEAIVEAVSRPTMRFVAVKSTEQQAALMVHRTRDLFIRQRTMLVNALRSHLAEFGATAAQGIHAANKLIGAAADVCRSGLPDIARRCAAVLAASLEKLGQSIAAADRQIHEALVGFRGGDPGGAAGGHLV